MAAAAAKWENAQPCSAPIKNMASTTASNVCDTTASNLTFCLGQWGLPTEVNQKFAVAAFAATDKFETFTFSYAGFYCVAYHEGTWKKGDEEEEEKDARIHDCFHN